MRACDAPLPWQRDEACHQAFDRLHLYTTRRRNAVLIFIAYEDRKLAILGDTGINEAVPSGFWDSEVDELSRYLKAGRPVDGLCEVIAHMGERLSQYFPDERDDENELSNEVSFDDLDDDEESADHHDDYGNME